MFFQRSGHLYTVKPLTEARMESVPMDRLKATQTTARVGDTSRQRQDDVRHPLT